MNEARFKGHTAKVPNESHHQIFMSYTKKSQIYVESSRSFMSII